MRRLVFLAQRLQQAKTVVQAIQALGIDEECIHVIAKDASQLEKFGLTPASRTETTEVENDMDWGMVAGGSFGLIAGLAAGTVLGPPSIVLGGGALLAASLLGIGVGGWLGRLVGAETPATFLQKYEHALQQGGFLMVIDTPTEQMPKVHFTIREHCPQALIEVFYPHWDHQQAA
ncbi:hypothetical protein [Neptuniibacter sp. CAU 1671]|uniref:hypothetical protein n=1 Tax=Neptuniibacter sp. CAU 1671 TaxID=3032593 RepID=UPI0023DA70B4|nr:hypothetical protein [Neptuniibacter sp. CAU 1671]MDF2181163.1 hypothetical protein [Neptuniibacter sp. CAU 1671]